MEKCAQKALRVFTNFERSALGYKLLFTKYLLMSNSSKAAKGPISKCSHSAHSAFFQTWIFF